MFNRLAFSKNPVHRYIAFGSHSKYEIIITLIDTNCLNFLRASVSLSRISSLDATFWASVYSALNTTLSVLL